MDRSGVNQFFKPNDVGTVVYDKSFAFTPECQEYFVEVCTDLVTNTKYKSFINRNEFGVGAVNCFMSDFVPWVNGTDLGWPVPTESIDQAFNVFHSLTDELGEPMTEKYDNSIGFDGRFVEVNPTALLHLARKQGAQLSMATHRTQAHTRARPCKHTRKRTRRHMQTCAIKFSPEQS